jgi:WD40 repeat protein
MIRIFQSLVMLCCAACLLSAQSQIPDVLWERGGNTRPAYDIVPLSKGRLLVGSFDGSVRLWDLATKNATLTLITTTFLGGRAMAVTPDEAMVITGDTSGWVRCWLIASGRLLFTLGKHTRGVNDIACSPKGDWVAVGDDAGVVRRWDLSLRTVLDSVSLSSPIRSIAVSPDGATMVVTTSLSNDKGVAPAANPARILNVPGLSVRSIVNGAAPGSTGNSPIYAAAFTSASRIRMVGSNAILTVDGATGSIIDRRNVDYGVAGGPEFIVVEDSASVITAGVLFAGLRRYTDARTDVDTIVEFGRQVSALAIDRSGKRLFMATQGNDVQVWDLTADTFMFDLEGMTGYLRRAAWSIDGNMIATASSSSDRIRLIDVANGSVAHTVENRPWGFPTPASMVYDNAMQSLYFTPVANDGIRRLRRYDVQSKSMDTAFSRRATSVVASRTTDRLIVLSRDSSFVLQSGNPQPFASWAIDACNPWVAMSTRDGRIVTSCSDTTIRILNGLSGQPFGAISVPASVIDILAPASQIGEADVLVFLQYGRTRPDAVDAVILDAENLQEKTVLPAIGKPFIDGFLGNRIACSKSAKHFAVGQDDGTIVIVETKTGARVKTLETGGSPVVFLSVHPDNEVMIAGTADGRVLRLRDPWPVPVSSIDAETDTDVLSMEYLRSADEVLWYTMDGRCVGSGANYMPEHSHQPYVVVMRFGTTVRSRLLLDGGVR